VAGANAKRRRVRRSFARSRSDSAAPIPTTSAVDYASFLAKHDIASQTERPSRLDGRQRKDRAIVSANGLTLQLSGVDTSPLTAFSAGLRT
jgi:hypothetical protein